MITDKDELWSLLRSLDEPNHLERPAGFDFTATRNRFEQLVDRLNVGFDCNCLADRHVQDASLHARVDVPAEATLSGEPLVVCVSNFGNLAVVSITNPGAWLQAELQDLLASQDAERLYAALDALSYVVVPEEPLWEDYDGPSPVAAISSASRVTWWTRYFDYL